MMSQTDHAYEKWLNSGPELWYTVKVFWISRKNRVQSGS